MTQSAFHASAGNLLDSYDFNQNYRYLRKLVQELADDKDGSAKNEFFAEDEGDRSLTKRQMKQLFRFLRKIEKHYRECCPLPIPVELEEAIRSRDSSDWLPWELEAIEKVEAWREELRDRKNKARKMFNMELEKVRAGGTVP